MKQLLNDIKQRLECRGFNQFKFNRYSYKDTAFRITIYEGYIKICYPNKRKATDSIITLKENSSIDDVEKLVIKHYQTYKNNLKKC